MEEIKKYYIYILRCEDLSLYTGITIDIEKRYKEHLSGKGAKYTRGKGVKGIELYFSCEGRSKASKIEYFFKSFKKEKKERMLLDFENLKMEIEKKLGIKIKKEKN